MENALERFGFSALHGLDEFIAQRPSRHADRALDDGDVFFPGFEIGFFEADVGVAFLGGDEAGSHLYAGCAEIHELFVSPPEYTPPAAIMGMARPALSS